LDELRESGEIVGLKPSESGRMARAFRSVGRIVRRVTDLPQIIGSIVRWLIGGWVRRIVVTAGFVAVTIIGIALLVPPLDYLPKGNRNLIFSVMVPPPGYTVDELFEIGDRIEPKIRPGWEAAGDRFAIEPILRGGEDVGPDARPELSLGPDTDETVTAPLVDQYFLVAREGRIFQAVIPVDAVKTPDALLFAEHAIGGGAAPDTPYFSFQFPLFNTGGTTGAAIKIDIVGDELDSVIHSATVLMGGFAADYGQGSVNPSPANFMLPTPELRVTPDDARLQDAGLSRADVGLATQASGDGILIVRRFERGGELKDLKIVNADAYGDTPLDSLMNAPIATRRDGVVDLASLADVERVRVQDQIRHVDRQRAVTIELTPPADMPLAAVVEELKAKVAGLRESGEIPPTVDVHFAGSAGKLNEITTALAGDGSVFGTLTSSLFLAVAIVYLLMVVLFQSWTYPLVIMISVPLATLGGFAGLAMVHEWTASDRYLPVQNMDVLTILGFVILAGVVVNNAILIVHQAINFRRDGVDEDGNAVSADPKEAIVQSVTSRVRPILMSTLTSVGGMLPLVFLTGPGSELYRGLGAVITGGLVVSTVFTMFLVPVVLSMAFGVAGAPANEEPRRDEAGIAAA
ncbi:MAG: efflux RND transporter permease subunit, partial [Planctomycetota bacterium]